VERYRVIEVGALDEWGDFLGGFTPKDSCYGRRVLEKELPLTFFGMTVNSRKPGDGIGSWHYHDVMDELYLFLGGEGEMGLDDDVLPVKAGSAVWVGTRTWRTWRCSPTSPTNLAMLCIRAGAGPVADYTGAGGDWVRLEASERPLPWPRPDQVREGGRDSGRDGEAGAGYAIVELGSLNEWGSHFGGLAPELSYPGRRVLEQELPVTYFGVTANSMEPGSGVEFWHSHSVLDELYLVLDGEGEMGLDDDVVPVRAGSAVWVGQGIRRAWRCVPASPTPMKWLCIRAGGAPLSDFPYDGGEATVFDPSELPLPWEA